MAAPSTSVVFSTTNNSTSGTFTATGAAAGDLLLIGCTDQDSSAPVITLTPSGCTLEGQSGATVILDDSVIDKNITLGSEKPRAWSVIVQTVTGGSPSIAWSVTNHTLPSTGTGRTIQLGIVRPGSGYYYATRATGRITRTGVFSGTGGAPNTIAMTGTLAGTPATLFVVVERSSATTAATIDVDQDGTGEISPYYDNVAKGFVTHYDIATAKRPSGNINYLGSTGTKTIIAVVYQGALAPITGVAVTDLEHPLAGMILGVPLEGHSVVEINLVRPAPTFVTLTGQMHIQAPRTGAHYRVGPLSAMISSANPGDVGEMKLSLFDGGTLLNSSSWTSLTGTPTELDVPITAPVTDINNLQLQWQARKLSDQTLQPVINTVKLAVEYWAAELDTIRQGSVISSTLLSIMVQDAITALENLNMAVLLLLITVSDSVSLDEASSVAIVSSLFNMAAAAGFMDFMD